MTKKNNKRKLRFHLPKLSKKKTHTHSNSYATFRHSNKTIHLSDYEVFLLIMTD